MEGIRRIGLSFLLIALMASMVALSALTGTAQSPGQYDAKTGNGSGQYDAKTGGGPGPSGGPDEDAIYCSPQWYKEWYQAQGWWYFWWYN